MTIWQQANSLTVHLVNLNNPMTMKGLIFRFYAHNALLLGVAMLGNPIKACQ
ncbi:MAG: hypothetical protein NT075_29700 [Chloroflexi bacterium]|nr:hypothetical protein [Chloroflexota bacterium]